MTSEIEEAKRRALSRESAIRQSTPRQLDARALAADGIQYGALQKFWEFAGLIQMVLDLKPRTIVEIGSDVGGSLHVWSRICNQVFSIDLPGGNFSSGAGARRSWGASVHDGDSHAAESREWLMGKLHGRRVDFLMIDGDHTYDGCYEDWAMYGPLVRPGGVVAFHDVCYHGDGVCRVDEVWQKVKDGQRTWDIIQTPTNWGGIGVLMK